jgi:hypothetical protein
VRPRTTCSDVVATPASGSAVALVRDNAVPGKPRWQVRFFGHFKPLCCGGEAVSWGRNAKALIVLKYLLALIPIGLIVLLGAGCQGGEAAENQEETLVEETDESSSKVKQTLDLTADMIVDIQKMEHKIAARKEAYASTGDTRGAQKMSEATTTAEDIEALLQVRQTQIASGAPPDSVENIDEKIEERAGPQRYFERGRKLLWVRALLLKRGPPGVTY